MDSFQVAFLVECLVIWGVEGGIVEMMEVPRHNKNLSNAEVLRAMLAPKVMKIFQDGLKSSKEVEIME